MTAKRDDRGGLKEKQRVVAASDLPGVPAGTRGRILVAYGIIWPRYRVVWENGAEHGNVDAKYLTPTR